MTLVAAQTLPMKPYPSYREAECAWISRVPTDWTIRRLRWVTELIVSNVDKHIVEGQERVRLCNYVDVYKNDFIRADMEFMVASAAHDEVERFRLHAADVVITKDSEDWRDIGVPAFVVSTAPDLVCGYHLAILRPRPEVVDGAFLHIALQSPSVAYQFSVAANGVTRYGLSQNAIKSIQVAVPPLSVQAAIVKYIGHVDRQIGRLTTTYRRLAGSGRFVGDKRASVLSEYRTRLIADVTTGALDVREAAECLPAVERVGIPDELVLGDDGDEPTHVPDPDIVPEEVER